MSRVLVLGDVMTDVVVRASGAPVTGTDVPARISTRGGGSAANVAAWMAHDGTPVTFIGRIGTDALGDAALLDLESVGVVTAVTRDPATPTGTCVVIVDPDGERTMLPDAGANDRLSASDVRSFAFETADHLHISGYAFLRAGSRDAAIAALTAARAAGLSISVSASSTAPLESVGPAHFLDWVTSTDVGLANAAEARVLTGQDDPEAAARAMVAHFTVAVVTCGARGSVAADRHGGVWSAPAVPGTLVDTTGAGDAFAAGFLGAWTAGSDVAAALQRGARLAGRAVAGVGARP